MNKLNKISRQEYFSVLTAVGSIIAAAISNSIAIMAFAIFCVCLFTAFHSFANAKVRVITASVCMLAAFSAAYISVLRLSFVVGYEPYTPGVSVFPFSGALVLVCAYFMMTSKDDADRDKTPEAKQIHSQSKTWFFISILLLLSAIFTYVVSYYFTPAVSLIISCTALTVAAKQIKKNETNTDK